MKKSYIKKYIALGLTVAGAVFTPNLHATATSIFIEGGTASSSVIVKELVALFGTGTITTNGSVSGNVYQLTGSSSLANLTSYNPLTIDVNLANGAIAGLNNLVSGPNTSIDTNWQGNPLSATFVDSATTPEAVGISATASGIDTTRPTYVVPLVYAKNTNSTALSTVTNLTSRQALALETGTYPATFFGSTSTNLIYFVGRNKNAAVRTEIDSVINNTTDITSFTNAGSGVAVQDTSADPGLPSASLAVSNAQGITNSITTIAVQNITTGLQALNYEGVPYSITNIINGSYAIWGHEFYYTKSLTDAGKLAVLNQLYKQVTNNVVLQTSTYANKFIPLSWLKVTRNNVDGGPIYPLPNY